MTEFRMIGVVASLRLLTMLLPGAVALADEQQADVPPQLRRWLAPQQWQRDTDGPILALGASGQFDDTHIFAPCVARLDDRFQLWYCGSQGSVANRVFALGLAYGVDGREFVRHGANPVLSFEDGRHSVLTPTLLRRPDGTVLRENGELRMWFSATDFTDPTGHHALYEARSSDGIVWTAPAGPLLSGVYAPTILKEDAEYRMWYTDVADDPWVIRLATSLDGRNWSVHPDPLLVPEGAWEKSRLFYPTVLKTDGVYLLWYGSYSSQRPQTTAIGMAVSVDGVEWHRNPHNPVLSPDPDRPWESHYTTSQSVIRNDDGSFRIWYASRKQPPFVNKYFAINTAIWSGPAERSGDDAPPHRESHPARVHCTPVEPIAGGSMVVCWKDSLRGHPPADVLVHFHGAPETVRRALARSELEATLVILNFPGLSTAYSSPFQQDADLFTTILERARSAIAGERNSESHPWNRVMLSSFSAGYGAVREIITSSRAIEQVDAIVAADSIYASLDKSSAERRASPQQMRDFLKFATLASEGKRSFILTHSAQPTPYASTTETADFLLRSLELERTADATIDVPTLHQQTRASRGRFLVLGFDGTSGEEHMQHLHHIDLFWDRLSDRASAPGSPSRPAERD